MSDELMIPLSALPALLVRERESLALITEPGMMADAEKRAAAIADLTKRAGLAVPIQNEATFLRAEALERLSVVVDEAQQRKELRKKGDRDHSKYSASEYLKAPTLKDLGISPPRLSEGRALARTGALAKAKAESEKQPDKPVSMDAILKQAKRSERETRLRDERGRLEDRAKEEIAGTGEPPVSLHVADLREWRPEGVATIVTDPPYVGDSIPLYEALAEFAVDVLPDGGALVVMTWQAILPGVIAALEHSQLAYRWTICWRYANVENTVDHKRRVFDCWKPILVYHKNAMPEDAPMLRDEIASQGGDKDFHEWGQSSAGFERLIRTFSQPGDVVCDPFLGGGTTAIAALAQTRRFAGCDIDEKAVETTWKRLHA